MEEATYLTRFASSVAVIHRRDTLRASKIMQDKAFANPKITFVWDSDVADITASDKGEVTGIVIRNLKTNAQHHMPVDGVFIAIGHTPNTGLFTGQIELDANGYVMTHGGSRTSVPGVFAAGDVQDHIYRQAITAAGSGCMAAIDAERYPRAFPFIVPHDDRRCFAPRALSPSSVWAWRRGPARSFLISVVNTLRVAAGHLPRPTSGALRVVALTAALLSFAVRSMHDRSWPRIAALVLAGRLRSVGRGPRTVSPRVLG